MLFVNNIAYTPSGGSSNVFNNELYILSFNFSDSSIIYTFLLLNCDVVDKFFISSLTDSAFMFSFSFVNINKSGFSFIFFSLLNIN